MSRFKFCKQLDAADIARVKDYARQYHSTAREMNRLGAALNEMQAGIIEDLCAKHKAPRGLRIVIDSRFMDELNLAFLHSAETDEDDPEADDEDADPVAFTPPTGRTN